MPSLLDRLASTPVQLEAVHVVLGGRPVLEDVHLDVAPGLLTVLTGPNGAGKSTLLEVVAGVRPPTSGHVHHRAAAVSLVPQRTAVPEQLPVTVRDVVTVGAWGRTGPWGRVGRDGRRRVDRALELLDLDGLARRPFATLSGGQRQRALLAQGLVRDADLLLLDEPTTGLDDDSVRRITEAITAEVTRGIAVVCATHDPDLVVRAGREVRLDAGRLRP